MEWALFIKRADELTQLEEDHQCWPSVVSPDCAIPYPASHDLSFTRVYYGTEFCEAVIPSTTELEECLFASLERGLSFTFVTPHVTDTYLDTLGACFDILSRNLEEAEVVVNDWGVLRMLKKRHTRLTPILGRVLNRSLIDHRKSNVTCLMYFPFRRFLWNYGVKRVEFDCPAQPWGIDLEKSALGGSLYFPFDCGVINNCFPGQSEKKNFMNIPDSIINRVIHQASAQIQE